MSIVGTSSQNPRFSPDSLPGLSLWLDAADANTLTLSGSNVTQWRDKSGNGSHASQASAGNQPTYTASNQTLYFNGGASNFLNLPNGTFPAGNGAYSVIALVTPVSGYHFFGSGNGSANEALFGGWNLPNGLFDAWFGVDFGVNGPQSISDQTTLAGFFYNQSQRYITANGTIIGSTNSTNRNSSTLSNSIGGFLPQNLYSTFFLREFLVFSNALSTSERQQVEGYLARKWGITALTGDPYRFGGPRILPTQISGCSLWLDGADPAGTGSPPAIGTSVSTWVDKSGNARNAISEGTSIPTFSNRGITYNGSGFYRTSYSAALPAETLFVVFRWASIGTGGPAFIGGTQWYQRLLYVDPAESRWIYFGGIASWGRWNTSPLSSNVDYMLGVTWNSSSVIMHLNGSSLATAGGVGNIASFSGSPTDSLIGGGGFNGTMYEIIGYNTVLTTAQRQQVEGYLANKWGLQASFPAPIAIGPYAGPIIPARAFSPLDVDGLSLWLDAADSAQFTFSSGSNISSVREKSGNNYTFTQGGTASRLTRTTVNGRPTIFIDNDGTNNAWMTSPVPLPSTLTVVQVLTPLAYSGPTAPFLWSWNTGGTGGRTAGLRCNSSNSINPYITWVGDNGNSLPITTGTSYVHFVEFTNSGANVRQSLNGTTPTAGTLTAYNVTPSVFLLGGDGPTTPTIYSRMYMSELIMFSNVLTTSQRQQLETYLAEKWGLRAIMSGVSHPYRFGPAAVLPTQIPGCVLWLDAADGAVFNGGATWTDKSGTGNHGINGTPGSSTMPTVTTWPNGLTAARFVRASKNSVKTTNVIPTLNITYFFVVRITGLGSGKQLLMINNVDGKRQIYTEASSFPAQVVALAAPATPATNVISVAQSVPFIYGATFSGGFNLYVNGTELGSSPLSDSVASRHYFGSGDGDNSYLSCDYGEILIYSTVLTTAQRQQIEGYLAWKWGLQSNLPGSTPSWSTIRRALTPVFAPTQIPGCALWLDAADTTTLTLSGSNITQWNDKSGLSNHFTNGGTTVAYQTNGAYFNGSALMQNTTLNGFQYGGTSLSTFVVVSVASVSGTGGIFAYGTISCGRTGYILYADTDSRLYGTLYCGDLGVNTPITLNTRTLIADVITFSGGASRAAWINGIPFATATATGDMTLTSTGAVRIGANGGGGQNLVGTINEVLFYNRAVSASERRRIEGYLAEKWGLLGSLGGVNHPSRFGPPMILPTQIAGCRMWLDAADATTLTLSGSNVTQWNDKSGQGFTLTVPSGYISPTYSNGVLNMSGSNALWSTTNFAISGNTPVTMFLVGSTTSASDNGPGAHFGYANAATPVQYFGLTTYQDSTRTFLFTPSCMGADVELILSPNISGQRYLLCGFYDGTVVNGTYNGTLRTSQSLTTANFAVRPFQIGLRNFNTGPTFGTVCECICYTGALSATQRQQLEGYLAWKWGLQQSLPSSSHPYKTFKP